MKTSYIFKRNPPGLFRKNYSKQKFGDDPLQKYQDIENGYEIMSTMKVAPQTTHKYGQRTLEENDEENAKENDPIVIEESQIMDKKENQNPESLQLQIRDNLIQHSNMIDSIMIELKPRLFQMYFKKTTKEELKGLLRQIREEGLINEKLQEKIR